MRTRLLVLFVVLLVLSTVVSDVAARQILQARSADAVDDSLNREITEFERLVRNERDPGTGQPRVSSVRAVLDRSLAGNVPGEDQVFVTFLDGRRHRASASDPVQAQLLTLAVERGEARASQRVTAQTTAGPVRYVTAPVRVDGRVRGKFVVGRFLRADQLRIAETAQVAAGVSIIVLTVVTLLAFLLAGRVLAPLRRVTESTRALGGPDLSRRVAVRGHDEVAELGRTINGMMDRLEGAFSSQKKLLRDTACELQRLIATVRGHLELMSDDPEGRRETIGLVTAELDRMSLFVDGLLLLANAESDDFLELRDVDLAPFTEELLGRARWLADREWTLAETASARIVADRQRLAQAVMNLARRAVTVTLPGDRIELGSACDRDEVRLWISSEVGSGDRPAAQADDPAVEGEPGPNGTGLELSIARTIAEGHGGRLDVHSGWEDVITFTCIIPAVSSPRAVPA